MNVCMDVCVYIYMYACMYVRIDVYIYMYICLYRCMYVRMYVCSCDLYIPALFLIQPIQHLCYGVATISRLLKIVGLFRRI